MNLPDLKGLRGKKPLAVAGALAAVALIILITALNSRVYAVSVDGKFLGNVKSKQVVETAKQKLIESYREKLGSEIQLAQNIEVTPGKPAKGDMLGEEELLKKLEESISVRIKAVAILINDSEVAAVKDRQTAESVLQAVKDHYVSRVPGELVRVEVPDRIKLAEKYVDIKQVMTLEDAKNLILNGTIETRTHTVGQGENLWSIAKQNGIPFNKLIEANPQLESADRLSPGDVIYLKEAKPLLNVTVVKRVTYEKPIPYKTQIVQDSSLWKWDQVVKQPGQNGVKQVSAELVYENGVQVSEKPLGEKVIKEPTARIVARGTKSEVAFRGSGRFIWPVTGQITSRFGTRWGEFHTGLDIANSPGTPVRAANAGVVTFAGRNGGYGKLVIVNHGGGFETYYAHLNTISVSVGEKVEKGEVLGTVGTTGRTTGPHLHFEVRVNGAPKNPLLYLGK
ncbi:M23 family metallopeptidase [Thermosediminibacter litoriperuensis]|uniref:Murein DD-endopeptidase MepM/ murein hydrolase activator NlpD n=1 Tax=Thermosediminibacter litoriperuensis TaxID=291989 RepID=A0A5S5AW82_9FIRM|nr:M23 family metallopeptidase [Thermosediminibacter litoriperuensis]TYP57443.1 murein DD-endopeptidase MepM/ murein hydrolase activator NlpD [Thermosediminibacter litoriperuensis]